MLDVINDYVASLGGEIYCCYLMSCFLEECYCLLIHYD